MAYNQERKDSAYNAARRFERKYSRMTELEVYYGDDGRHTYLKRVVEQICHYPHGLRSITICCKMSNKLGVKFAGYLAKTKTLTTLNLCDNKLKFKAFMAIADALTTNTSLSNLDLSGNRLWADSEKGRTVKHRFTEVLEIRRQLGFPMTKLHLFKYNVCDLII